MTTNYYGTFIAVAPDCPVDSAQVPPATAKPTVARLQYDLLESKPYQLTSDDLLFEVYAVRRDLAESDKPAEREAFFAKSQACLRASPLAKRYGWGLHHDADGKVALVPLGTEHYEEMTSDEDLVHKAAMRSSRA